MTSAMNPFARWPAYLMIAVVLVCSAALALVFWLTPTPAPVGVSLPAQPAAEVKAMPTTAVAIKTRVVHVYPPRVKSALNLPAETVADDARQVISTAKVPADDRPHTVTTTIDLESGQAQSFIRPDSLPWLAAETRGEAGISYGIKNGEPAARISLRQNLIQIKAVRLGATATLDQDGDWYAGLGAFYRW
jgi:hypothetical protein